MKLLLTHRYFWPDTAPYALMLRSISEGLAQDGHSVNVFCSKPSYRANTAAPATEVLNGIKIKRAWVFQENKSNVALRILNVVIYSLRLFFHILFLRPDIVTASTFPPVIVGWFASLATRIVGAKFIYHMQDIHPEVSQYSGGFLGKPLPAKILRWLDNQTLGRASAIVVLSDDMADTLRNRGNPDLPIHVINNFLLQSFDPAGSVPEEYTKRPGITRAIFAGNLGRFQNLPLLTEGIVNCLDRFPELELFFLGDGVALPEIKEKWGAHPQVKFAPFLPFSQAQPLIADANIGLVSLSPNIYRVAYPSKVLSYLGLGVPIFALIEPDSQLAQSIVKNGLGAVPQNADAKSIEQSMAEFMQGPSLAKNVRKFHAKNLSQDVIIKRWRDLIKQTGAA
jgi:glycosyltransferase involved in cell wall biosynthesis